MMEIPDAPAFWISPDGKLIPVYKTHIHEVIDYPLAFGLTDKYVKGLYKKYKEPLYSESTARCEIVANLIRKGWIRIRYRPSRFFYSIELLSLTKKTKDYLWAWASEIIKSDESKKYRGVIITELERDCEYEYNTEDLAREILYTKDERISTNRAPLIILENTGQMLELGKWT
jgi:hypothetical protein